MKRVLVGMSGGVDSSVTAYLLKEQGYECVGVTMKLYDNEIIGKSNLHTCCSLDDVEDARSVAWRLGMKHYTFNFSDTFRETVVEPFVRTYQEGGTPNPCIECNRHLKFARLMQRAKELGCDYVATGHYARIVELPSGRFGMLTASEMRKDQSYVLYSMTQEQLAHTLFPLGGMSKAQVRQIAEEQGFVNAHKHDSQDICFVPDGDYVGFLERFTGWPLTPGPLLNPEGKVVGTHKGAAAYTIGQRKGLGVALGYPAYVCGKDMQANSVTVGPEELVFADGLIADDWNWIAFDDLKEPMRVQVRTRYQQPERWATVWKREDGRYELEFEQPQRAVTVGQAVVLYLGEQVLGGGTIRQAIRKRK